MRFQKIFIQVFALGFYLSFAACSSKSSAPVEVSQSGENYDSTSSDQYDSGSNTLFNKSDNSNLFSPTTTETQSTVQYPTVSQQQQACLNGTALSGSPTPSPVYNPSIPPWQQYNQGTGLSSACMTQANNGSAGQNSLLNFGLQNFGYMQLCYELVMSKGPQMCSSGQSADEIFKMSGVALVRCFRQLLAQQMQYVQWQPQQKQVYQQTDNSFMNLIFLIKQLDLGGN